MEGANVQKVNWRMGARSVWLAVMLASGGVLSGCLALKPTVKANAAANSTAFQRHDGPTPFLSARLFYADATSVRKLVDQQDDFARRFKGLRRVGDGVLSVGVRDGRGRWLETFECGGHLFVSAPAGQTCQIVVRNESKARLEILAGMDGNDVSNGGTFDLKNPGRVILPYQTLVFGKISGSKSPALRFGKGRSPSAGPVVEARLAPPSGSILVVAFMEKDVFPWEGRIRRQTSSGEFPQRRYHPNPLSSEYR